MINLLKENDIKRELTLEEYIDWCILYNKTKIVNIKSSGECSKEEILAYSSKLNKAHKSNMNNKAYADDTAKMFKCYTCEYNKEMSKSNSLISGKIEYTVTCVKEMVCFGAAWDSHVSNLPCWKENKEAVK